MRNIGYREKVRIHYPSYLIRAAVQCELTGGGSSKHKDLKPQNILVHGENVIITDMGSSREFFEDSETLGTSLGSRMYMAPEVHKKLAHGRRQDIWSLVCCFIEMFAFLKDITLPEFQEQLKLGVFCHNHELVVEWLKSLRSKPVDEDELALVKLLLNSFQLEPAQRPYAQDLVDQIRDICRQRPYKYIGECCAPEVAEPTRQHAARTDTATFPTSLTGLKKGSLLHFVVSAGCYVLRDVDALEVRSSLIELLERA